MPKTPLLPLLILLVALLPFGCGGGASDEAASEDSAAHAVAVQVAKAQMVTMHPRLELVGTVVAVPEQTAMVAPQFGGSVEKVAVVEGQHVKAGDLLVQLDSHVARTDVARARGALDEKAAALERLQRGYLPREIEGARKDRDKAQATLDGLQNELTALEGLRARGEVSPVAYETKAKAVHAAEATLASAEARLQLLEEGTPPEQIAQAKGLLEVAQADLDHAELVLEWCSITSPIDGVVTKLMAYQGQFFDRAVPLATVIDLSSVFVQLRVPSRDFAKVRVGSPVEARLDSLAGRTFEGKIARISGEADPQTGNFIVFARLQNQEDLLRPGLGCNAGIALPDIPDALAIPVAAVGDNAGTPVATVIRDGKAYETEVELGAETSELAQIVSGLSAGDVVATSGGYGLPDGCPVRIVEGPAAQ
ncbi:MAG: efflux RND transporter periplasmic adaptor subunit [Acidobacteria bacterium]|nr:efflux RND transporter periplasmic adaptor subunit [Acidobacteriota bacterium]